MKYSIGDKVRVRNIRKYEQYGDCYATEYHQRQSGEVRTINDINTKHNAYYLNGLCEMWTEDMLEPVEKEAAVVPVSTEDNPVSHPSHYTDGRIEVIDFIQDKGLNFCRGNIVKYVARAGKKGDKAKEIEDLKKARQYCDFEINMLEGRV